MPKSNSVVLNSFFIQGFDPQQQRPASFSRSKKLSMNNKKSYIWTDQVLRGGDVVPRGRLITVQQTSSPTTYSYWILLVLIITAIMLIIVLSITKQNEKTNTV